MKKLLFLGVITSLMFATTSCEQPKTDNYIKGDTLVVVQKDTFCLNEQSVYNMIIEEDIQHPRIVLKQSILETGWFTSDHCIKRNNLFGFRNSKGYMSFNEPKESVKFYKQWQNLWYNPINTDYYRFLKDIRYAEDSTYVDKLKQIEINV